MSLVETYETKIGPRNGAKVVAKAWTDPAFREWLLADATAAIASLGFTGRQGEHMVALENTPDEHNMVVCTLCSCYPWPVLGLPPVWYKSAPYRSRAVIDPRGVLAEFGVELPKPTRIRVWDSTAEVRYLVVPMRPEGTEGWSEDALADLVTRDSMIGTGLALRPASGGSPMNGAQDLGGMMGFGPDRSRGRRALVPRRLGAARARADARHGRDRPVEHRHEPARPARACTPADYLSSSYYEIWTKGLEKLVLRQGLVTEDELAAGHALGPPKPVARRAQGRDRAGGARQRQPVRPAGTDAGALRRRRRGS